MKIKEAYKVIGDNLVNVINNAPNDMEYYNVFSESYAPRTKQLSYIRGQVSLKDLIILQDVIEQVALVGLDEAKKSYIREGGIKMIKYKSVLREVFE